MDMYRSGLDVLPGSAMQKSKHSLGFLCVEVQLLRVPERDAVRGRVVAVRRQRKRPRRRLMPRPGQ